MECPYCGKTVRESDKFCLYCGEPLLKHSQPEPTHAAPGKVNAGATNDRADQPAKEVSLFPQTATPLVEIEEKLREGSGTPAPASPDKEREAASHELDPAIKEEIQARIDLFQLAKKIKKVQVRINDSLDMMEDGDFKKKYDLDDDFRKANAVRFEALKQIGEELKKQKVELESKISPTFELEMNNKKIKRLKSQIEELNYSFKMRKIDRKAYDALHAEYKIQLTSLLKEREIANIQLGAWVRELKADQEDLKHQFNVLKGRKAAKEISKEELKEERAAIEKKLARLAEDIKVIESFIFSD